MNDPDILSLNGAGAALALAAVPFLGPIGAVRVGRINGEFIAMPNAVELGESDMDMVIAGTAEAVTMVEAGMNEISEEIAIDAIAYAHEQIKKICKGVEALRKKTGWKPVTWESPAVNEAANKAVADQFGDAMREALTVPDKLKRNVARGEVVKKIREALVQSDGDEAGRFSQGRCHRSHPPARKAGHPRGRPLGYPHRWSRPR